MKIFRRILSALLALSIVCSMITSSFVTVHADEGGEDISGSTVTDSELTETDYLYPTGGNPDDEGVCATPEEEAAIEELYELSRESRSVYSSYDASASDYNTSSTYLYEQLNSSEKKFYDSLKAGCETVSGTSGDINTTVTISGTEYELIRSVDFSEIGFDRAVQVYYYFKFSNPQYFFISNTYGYSKSSELFHLLFMNRQGHDFSRGSQRKAAQTKLDTLTDSWMAQISQTTDDYEKEQIIIKNVCDLLTYDYSAANDKDLLGFEQSIISGILNNTTVCAGYAMLTAYFCNAAGLECFYVNSSGHAWNIVKLYGTWFELDNTWYDTNGKSVWVNKSHSTFLANDNNNSHVYKDLWNHILIPDCVSDVVDASPKYSINSSGIITSFTGSASYLTIPDSVNGAAVKGIGTGVFSDIRTLHRETGTTYSVTVPECVLTIGSSAFENNSNLTELTLCSSLESIGRYAFRNCTNLERIYFDGKVSDWYALTGSVDTGITSRTVIECADEIIDNRDLKSVSLYSKPVKLEYYEGDEFDITGCRLSVVLTDGTAQTVDVTDDMVSGYDPAKTGTQTVTVSYRGKKVTFTVTVAAVVIESLRFSVLPKMSFYIDEPFTADGGVLTVNYNNGRTENRVIGEDPLVTVNSTKYDSTKAGSYPITVLFDTKSLSYTVDVSVDPENAKVSLAYGSTELYYNSIEEAFAKITALEDKSGIYTVNVFKDTTEKKLTFPAYAERVIINAVDGASIYTPLTALSPECDLELRIGIVHISTENEPDGKKIALKAGANSELGLYRDSDDLGAVSGTASSTLTVGCDTAITGLSAFGNVTVGDGSVLTVSGKMNGIGWLKGTVKLTDTSSASDVEIAESAKIILVQGADKSGNTILPKLTVTDVTDELELEVADFDGNTVKLVSGTPVLTAGGNTDFTGKITIANENIDASAGSPVLKAFIYKKEIRAEYPDELTVSGGISGNYPNFESALGAIDSYEKKNKVNAGYTITMNSDATVKKLTLPPKAGSLTIDGSGHTLTLVGVKNAAPKYAFNITNLNIKAVDKKGADSAFTLNLTTGNAVIDGLGFTGKTLTVKGGTKNTLDITGCGALYALTGFDTITLNSSLAVEKTLTAKNLTLGENADLSVGPGAAVTIKKMLKGSDGSVITLNAGFKPITLSGVAEGTIILKGIKASGTTQILNSKKADLGVFDVSFIQPGEGSYALTRTGAKVYCRPAVLDLDGRKYVTFADIVTAVESAADRSRDYVVSLDEDYSNAGALKFPKAGTYASITITSDSSRKFTFTGNVNITGNVTLDGIRFGAVNLRTGADASYTVNAAKGSAFTVKDCGLALASSIAGVNTTVVFDGVQFSGKITAEVFRFSGLDGVIESLNVGTIYADGAQTLKLSEKKTSTVRVGQDKDSGKITVQIVDNNGNDAVLKNGTAVFAKFAGEVFSVDIANTGTSLSRDAKTFKVTVNA